MQLVDLPRAFQHRFTKLQAVGNGQRLHHNEHGGRHSGHRFCLTPPIKSEAFWFVPDILPQYWLHLWLRAQTPRNLLGWRLVKASAWIEKNKSARCFWAFATRTCNGMKMSSLRVMYTFILPSSLDQRAQTASYLQYHVFSRVLYFPTAPESSPPWPGRIMTIGRSRPALPVVGPLCAGGTCFRGRLCCNPPAAPAAGPAYPVHWPDRGPSPDASLNPATGARANSCGFTFCFNSKPYVRFAGQLPDARRLDERSSARICAAIP